MSPPFQHHPSYNELLLIEFVTASPNIGNEMYVFVLCFSALFFFTQCLKLNSFMEKFIKLLQNNEQVVGNNINEREEKTTQ